MATFTKEEVAKHNTEKDCWVIIENQVFDISNFLSEHPGGKKVLVKVAGSDASKQFQSFHKPEVLVKYSPQLLIGKIGEAKVEEKKEQTNEQTTQFNNKGLTFLFQNIF